MLYNHRIVISKSIHILSLVLFLTAPSFGSFSNEEKELETYHLKSLDEVIDLIPYANLYVDDPPFQKPEEIIKNRFSPYSPLRLFENPVEKANKRYWINFRIKNSTQKKVDRASLFLGHFDRILVFTIKNGKPKLHQKLGEFYKSKINHLSKSNVYLPIKLEALEEVEYLIHISSGSHMFTGSNELVVNILPSDLVPSQAGSINKPLQKGLLYAGILFLIGVILLISISLSFYNKERRTVAFSLLCLSVLAYYLRDMESYFTQIIFWSNWDELSQRTEVMFRGFIAISFLLFTLFSFSFGKWRKTILKTSTLQICFTLFVGIWIYNKIAPYKSFTSLEVNLYLADIILSVLHSSFVLTLLWRSGEAGTMTYIGISYAGLFLNLSYPQLSAGFFSSNLMSLYGITFLIVCLVFIILKDLYGLKKHLIKESIRAENLEHLNETKTHLYTNITHELRTPLTIITGLSRKLKGNEQSKQLIINNSQNLLGLINKMLDLSKLESGMVTLETQTFELISYMRVLVDSFRSLANEKTISLNFYSDEEFMNVEYDKEKLKIIISNLITNAIKYTSEFGNVIVICKQPDQSTLQIIVKDNGIGIAKENIEQVFDRFYKIDQHKRSSNGIGLAIVKQLVRLMGGDISVKSKLKQGSQFILSLPYKPVDLIEEKTLSEKTMYKNAIENIGITQSQLPEGKEIEILVIEDNHDIRHYINLILKDNFKVKLVENGSLGIQYAKSTVPDLIITDIMMPGINGVEVCKALKSDTATSHIPVIMLTAKADNQSKLTGLDAGADVYLIKPFDENELLLKIANLISARERYQQHFGSDNVLPNNKSSENEFLKKVKQIIDQNLEDENFSMQELCKLVHLERSQLYRKINALTGTTPAKLIKQKRLARAHELINSNHWSISEIAFKCGFKDVSYFSRLFKEAYGKSPSQLISMK